MEGADLAGRVAIVTGSSRRNGRAIARSLASAGAAVVINARSSMTEAEGVASEIIKSGGRAIVCMADVAKEADGERLIATALKGFGALDILVNNAAIRAADRFDNMTFSRWREVNSIILDGAFICARAAAPHLRKSSGGRIVNIGGISGHKGASGRAHVVAAKAGLLGLTKALALELAPEVTVNCVSPGRIEDSADSELDRTNRLSRLPSDNIPLRRSGTTADVASAVRFLCSDAAGYVTGQTLHVNGGAYFC